MAKGQAHDLISYWLLSNYVLSAQDFIVIAHLEMIYFQSINVDGLSTSTMMLRGKFTIF